MLIGILSVAGAATLLGIMPSMQKTLLVGGLPMNSLMFFTNMTISCVCMAMARIRKCSLMVTGIQLAQTLIMGISAYCPALKYQLSVPSGGNRHHAEFPLPHRGMCCHGNCF